MKSTIPVFECIINQNLTSHMALLPINGEEDKKSLLISVNFHFWLNFPKFIFYKINQID